MKTYRLLLLLFLVCHISAKADTGLREQIQRFIENANTEIGVAVIVNGAV